MTVISDRLEALIVARAHTSNSALSARELVQPLARFAPTTLTETAWIERLSEVARGLRERGVLREDHRPRGDVLAQMIGHHSAKTWPQLADRILPALALGVAADDAKTQSKLAGRDMWSAAIMARALDLWTEGSPPSLAAVCDALAWRKLGLAGKPKRCPPEIRALFVQRELATDAGPPDRLVRALAARAVAAPRPELRALRDALVKMWLGGRTLGGPRPFASEVRELASATRDGVFGDRKVFIASVWSQLKQLPTWASMTLDEFKQRLIAAHRAGDLTLARADLVAAMDPHLVATSEINADGSSFHFIIRETIS
ncbi:MAG: hypothetical protein JWO36_2147 [Myxococcales bacterium]|nr:hypothetical protein [Myxococcales bacterium]